jgi:hypothetical protein
METGIESISLPTKEVIPSETQRLEWVFGKEAEINQKENGEWSVNVKLKSRGMVPGNQEVNFDLGNRTDIKIGLGDNYSYNFENAYQVNKFMVNNQEVELSSEMYILPEEPGVGIMEGLSDEDKNKHGEVLNLLNDMILGGHSSPRAREGGKVTLSGFDAAEDLAILMHEFGHTKKDPMDYDRMGFFFMVGAVNDLKQGEHISEESAEVLLQHLKVESEASRWAVQNIEELRNQGVDLFPGDPNLTHIKLLLALSMSTYLGSGSDINLGKQVKNPEQLLEFKTQENKSENNI